MPDDILAADETYRAHMQRGSDNLKVAIWHARDGRPTRLRLPQGLLWVDRQQPANWLKRQDSLTSLHQQHMADLAEQRDRQAVVQRVSRDPCPRCAVRADIGCSHRRVA